MGRIFAEQLGLERISFEKLADVLSDHHTKAKSVEDLFDFKVDIRHIQRDKRTASIPFVEGLAALA